MIWGKNAKDKITKKKEGDESMKPVEFDENELMLMAILLIKQSKKQ